MKVNRTWPAKIIGSVFFLAGTFKLMDPVGTSLIVGEYFKFLKAFFLVPAAWWTGFLLSLCETVLGAALVTGFRKRLSAIVSASFLIAFTILTLILWIKNPNMDCGCFGQVLHLTHFQSFIKNIILDILWILAFIPLKNLAGTPKRKVITFGTCAVSICLFGLYFANSNPAVDYASMYPGAELFRPNDFLSEDDPILSFCNAEGEYADSLAYTGKVIAVSVYSPAKVWRRTWVKIRSLSIDSEKHGFNFLLLMPELPENPDPILSRHSFLADRRTLMTLNRSNGGATYINGGMIVKKWEARKLPDFYDLIAINENDATEIMMNVETVPALAVEIYILLLLAIMFLI